MNLLLPEFYTLDVNVSSETLLTEITHVIKEN